MTPIELSQRLAALDWSGTSLQHQLAVACAVETLGREEEREAVAAAMMHCSLATGHGDTLESLLAEVQRLQDREERDGVVELPAFLPRRAARNYLKLVVDSPF